jgi:hypothetical protein
MLKFLALDTLPFLIFFLFSFFFSPSLLYYCQVLNIHQYIPIERETDHWVKIKGSGWVLKAQEKYGQLIVPVKQQHYEKKYNPAATVLMFASGKMSRPFATPSQRGGGKGEEKEEKKEEEDEVGRIVKRIVVAPPRYEPGETPQELSKKKKLVGLCAGKSKREEAEEAAKKELHSIPPPPPKGWELLLHKPSGKMYKEHIYIYRFILSLVFFFYFFYFLFKSLSFVCIFLPTHTNKHHKRLFTFKCIHICSHISFK